MWLDPNLCLSKLKVRGCASVGVVLYHTIYYMLSMFEIGFIRLHSGLLLLCMYVSNVHDMVIVAWMCI